MDSGLLADLVDHIAATGLEIDSITVVRNGYMVLDTVFYPFPPETAHVTHSVTKSVVGTLIGIAIQRGLLRDVSVPVVEVLAGSAPSAIDDRKTVMSVADLLTMSAGLDCRDSYLYGWAGLEETRLSDDWAAHVLALPMSEQPGTRFEYCNGASHLLSAILSQVTGSSALTFAEETLFGPLGITDATWLTSPGGINIGWGELMLRPRDMAKIGYFYLRGGAWDGEQIVPEEWTAAATSTQIDSATISDGYGYQWWIDDDGYKMALGLGGQYIIVVPESDLVVVFTSSLPGYRFEVPEDLLQRYVLAAVIADRPLPANPVSEDRLAEAIARAAAPSEAAMMIRPGVEEIDGVTHEFGGNTGGFEWFRFDFDGDSVTMTLEDIDGLIEVDMAFDGRFHVAGAWGRSWAFRPEWTDETTLTIEFQIVGRVGRGEFEFVFEDDTVHMRYQEITMGTYVNAVAAPA